MTREQARQQIDIEFAKATHARHIGNDGMVRVCARRAAGIAITCWLRSHPRTGWGENTMSLLRILPSDDTMPLSVREAAQRLSLKITERFASPSSPDPLEDSITIIDHLLENA